MLSATLALLGRTFSANLALIGAEHWKILVLYPAVWHYRSARVSQATLCCIRPSIFQFSLCPGCTCPILFCFICKEWIQEEKNILPTPFFHSIFCLFGFGHSRPSAWDLRKLGPSYPHPKCAEKEPSVGSLCWYISKRPCKVTLIVLTACTYLLLHTAAWFFYFLFFFFSGGNTLALRSNICVQLAQREAPRSLPPIRARKAEIFCHHFSSGNTFPTFQAIPRAQVGPTHPTMLELAPLHVPPPGLGWLEEMGAHRLQPHLCWCVSRCLLQPGADIQRGTFLSPAKPCKSDGLAGQY